MAVPDAVAVRVVVRGAGPLAGLAPNVVESVGATAYVVNWTIAPLATKPLLFFAAAR